MGERYFTAKHRYDPFNATLLGLTEFDGLTGDPSADSSAGAASVFASLAAEAAELDDAALTDDQRIDKQVLRALLRGAEDDARHSLWAANASSAGYGSRQGTLFQAAAAVSIADADGAERYLTRLGELGDYLGALGDRYRHEATAGRVPTAVGVLNAVRQLRSELNATAETSALLRAVAGPNAGAGTAWRERAEQIVADTVAPGMASLAEVLERELLPVARDDEHVGIRTIPGGEEGYAAALRQHTTTDLTAEDIHQLGLRALTELDEQWAQVGARALGETDRRAIADRLRGDPALRFETTGQIVDAARGALERAEAALPRYFPADKPIGSCEIVELSAEESANSAMAYYRPPAGDGSRGGAQCIATADPTSRHRYEYEALSFHESVPGHHLQLATSQLLDIPCYRRHLDVEVCGFNEGWGLYTEQLADELGLYSSEVARLGMLSFSALRACRLVVDTGMHQLGWSRAAAIEFMWSHTATTREHVEHEVDRYISWPGQACAYMVGKREILRMRARAQAALGSRFDLPGFHWAVIGNGAVPLSVADEATRRWQER